jgi:hypothetical protein
LSETSRSELRIGRSGVAENNGYMKENSAETGLRTPTSDPGLFRAIFLSQQSVKCEGLFSFRHAPGGGVEEKIAEKNS